MHIGSNVIHIDERIIIHVILGCLLEVVQLLMQLQVTLPVFVHHTPEENHYHHHQHAPESHQDLLALRVVLAVRHLFIIIPTTPLTH